MSEEANPSQQTKARPLRYWQQFNSWWRSELERKGVRPSGHDIGRWYTAESDAAWGAMAKPSLEDTRSHAKSLRSVTSVREYFRDYRTKKKHEGEGDIDNDLLLSCQHSSSDGRGRSRESSGTGGIEAAIQTFNASTSSSQQLQQQLHNPRGSAGNGKKRGSSNAGSKGRATKHSLAVKPPPHAALQCSSSLPAAPRQQQGIASSHRPQQFAIHPGALAPAADPGHGLPQPAQAAAAAAAAGQGVLAWPDGALQQLLLSPAAAGHGIAAGLAGGGLSGGLPAGVGQHGHSLGQQHSYNMGADGSSLQGQQPWVQEQQHGHAQSMQGGSLAAAQHQPSLAVEQPPPPAAYNAAVQQQQQQQHLLQGHPQQQQGRQGHQQVQQIGKQQQQLQPEAHLQFGAAAYSLQPGMCPSSHQQQHQQHHQQQQLQQTPYHWLDQQQWQPQWQWHHPASAPGSAQQQLQPGLPGAAPAAAQQLEHTQRPYLHAGAAQGHHPGYGSMRLSDNTAVTVNDVVPPPPAPSWQQPDGLLFGGMQQQTAGMQQQQQQQLPPLRVSTFLDGTPFGEAARRLSQAQALDQLALPQQQQQHQQQQQRLSLYALSSDALDIFGKDGLDGLDLDAFLGTLPCGPGGGPGSPGGGGQAGEMVAPIAPGSRTTVLMRPPLELPDHWLQSAMAAAFGGGGLPPHHPAGADAAGLADLALAGLGGAGMQLPPVAPGSFGAAAGGEERGGGGGGGSGGGAFSVPVLDLSGSCKRSRHSGLLPDDRAFKVPVSLASPGSSSTPARSRAAAAVAALAAGPAFSALAAAAGRGGRGPSGCSQSPGGGRRSGKAGRAGGSGSSAQDAAAVACGSGDDGSGKPGGAGAGDLAQQRLGGGDSGAACTLTPVSTAPYKFVLNLADSSDDLPFPFAQPTPQPQQQHGEQEREGGAPSPLRISTRQLDALPLPQQQAWLDPALLLHEAGSPWSVSPSASPGRQDCAHDHCAGAQAAAGLFGGSQATTSHDGWQWQQPPQQLWQGQGQGQHACPSSSNPLQAAGAGQSRRPVMILNLADDATAPLPPDAFAAGGAAAVAAGGAAAGGAEAAAAAVAVAGVAVAAHAGLQKGFLPAMHEIESMI